ncbi:MULTISPECIES: MFS transporter [unclassified Ornithinimicrobium]|uniref:MFS transporter n=1 Tax=unclassified Ornithinimicrobium TaxID=2615080 RepID=UPI00385434D1
MSTSSDGDRTFHHLLVNTAVAGLTTSFAWFALTFWAYLETRSVLATGLIGGSYMLLVSMSSILFGSIVDHHRKLQVMRFSTTVTLVLFAVAGLVYSSVPQEQMTDLLSPWFWLFGGLVLIGSVVEHMRNIALSTCVTILVPDDRRDKANGLVGTAQGIAFMTTSVLSGLSIGFLGMGWTLALALVVVAAGLVHLAVLRMPQEPVATGAGSGGHGRIDLAGSIAVIRASSGLLALIVFATFNNLVGGAFMALMDPYGLEMFSVEVWGLVLGVTSTGFIVGGIVVARVGLGANPMRTLLLGVMAMGFLGAMFTVRELWWLYAVGIFAYMCLVPVIEAAEQTVIQRVVPLERQGRVFGLAMAVEVAAAPLTAFIIAPVADRWIIPFARTAEGQQALEPWVGVGTPVSRGIAIIFLVAGLVMVLAALAALASPAFRTLSRTYAEAAPPPGGRGPVEEGHRGEGEAVNEDVGEEDGDPGGAVSATPGQAVGPASAAAALTLPEGDHPVRR